MWSNSLTLFKQELMVAIIIFILLFFKLSSADAKNERTLNFVNLLLFVNFISGFLFQSEGNSFGSMFHTTRLICFEKDMLNFGTLIISLQSYDWLRNHDYVPEFYILILSTLLGMFFMISGANLLIFYLGLELSTIPLAALANFDLGKKKSSEAAMKLIMSSAFSSGLLLFGISLVYGSTGFLDFAMITKQLDGSSLQSFAFILLLSGFGFKISVVPFHLWTADVYEGSPVSVTSYLSVISKAAIFFVLVPVLYTVFKPLYSTWYQIIFLLSVLTMLVGNLFALRQQNLKRLLAFSSIAQVGFILVGLSGNSRNGNASVIYFLLIYIFSNLGAFGVVALISQLTGKEGVSDYKGLYTTNPFLSWILTIALFSLAGIPPTAGFFGKFFLLTAGAAKGNYVLLTIAALNMIISLYYYLRIVRVIFMDSNDYPIETLKIRILPKLGMLMCVTGIVFTGIAGWVYDCIYSLTIGF